jgi:hypothetical protein
VYNPSLATNPLEHNLWLRLHRLKLSELQIQQRMLKNVAQTYRIPLPFWYELRSKRFTKELHQNSVWLGVENDNTA